MGTTLLTGLLVLVLLAGSPAAANENAGTTQVPLITVLVLMLFSLLLLLGEDASRQRTPPASKPS